MWYRSEFLCSASTSWSSPKCEYKLVRLGDDLLHVFMHHIGKTKDQLQEILWEKMLQHLNWLEQISAVVLKEVNVSLEDYIDTMSTPGVLLDFVALMFLCCV